MLGSNCRSAIATLVERQTRFVMLVHLPEGHGAVAVRDGLLAAIKTLPAHLRKTLTWDSHTGSAPGVGRVSTWDRLRALPWIRRPGSCPRGAPSGRTGVT